MRGARYVHFVHRGFAWVMEALRDDRASAASDGCHVMAVLELAINKYEAIDHAFELAPLLTVALRSTLLSYLPADCICAGQTSPLGVNATNTPQFVLITHDDSTGGTFPGCWSLCNVGNRPSTVTKQRASGSAACRGFYAG